MVARWGLWAALGVFAVGCGGGSDGPSSDGAGGSGGAGGNAAGSGGMPGGSGGSGGQAPDAAPPAGDAGPRTATSIALAPSSFMELKRGETHALHVTATYDDGTTGDVTAQATFETSNADVATVDGAGTLTVVRGGPVTITAHLGDLQATLSATATCDYPRFGNAIRYGAIMPPLYWEHAFQPDGSQFDFKLADVYCNADYKDVKVVFIIVSAGWCTPCTLYAQRLRPDAEAIRRAGGLIAIMEVQTEDYTPADNAYAQRHIQHIIGDAYAIRIGDHDTKPRADWVEAQPLVTFFPTVIAVRTSDMKVITDSARSQYYLPLIQIAENPEMDWSNPGPPPFSNHCGGTDEEASEPNDMPAQATPLAPGTVNGGICNEQPDFYKIDAQGDWSVSLQFDSNVGDLDVYAWDEANNQPLQNGQDVVGSYGTTGIEAFTWHGPTTLAVVGYQGGSAPYRLTLTAQ
jgi:hypothetical protein